MSQLKILILAIVFLLSPDFFLHTAKCWAQGGKKSIGIKFLPEIIAMPGFEIGAGIFFSDENPEKNTVIQAALSNYGLTEKVWINPESGEKVRVFATSNRLETPIIEFHRINNVKYLVRAHKVRQGFPLVFSENFNQDWKIFLTPLAKPLPPEEGKARLSLYKTLQSNERGQASPDELGEFVANGLVTELGDGQVKTRQRSIPGEKQERKTIAETYTVDFVSKNFHGTIQNDNMLSEKFWETWFPGGITSRCSEESKKKCQALDPAAWQVERGRHMEFKSIVWPEPFHWQVNGYANSWWMDPNLIRQLLPPADDRSSGYYRLNPDGSMEFQLIIEYWPQRLAWVGGGISLATFLLCMIFLFFRGISRKVNVNKCEPGQA